MIQRSELEKVKCRKCGKVGGREEFHTNPKRKRVFISMCKECASDYNKAYKNRFDARLKILAGRAKTKNPNTDITFEFILNMWNAQNSLCYYTGYQMQYRTEKNHDFFLVSIDRLDSSKTYTQDNIVLCCWGINQMKRDESLEEFFQHCKAVLMGPCCKSFQEYN